MYRPILARSRCPLRPPPPREMARGGSPAGPAHPVNPCSSVLSLAGLAEERGEVWQCIVGHLALSDLASLGRLGMTCRQMYRSVLHMPFATMVDDAGASVLATGLYFEGNGHIEYCRNLLESLDQQALGALP